MILRPRDDRLGAQLFGYISQIVFSIHNNLYIKYDRETLPFRQSIFLQVLFDVIDEHNRQIHDEDFTKLIHFTNNDLWNFHFLHTMSKCVLNIQSDIVSFLSQRFNLQKSLRKYAKSRKYEIPFDPSKTILVHLRLDDVSSRYDYDGRICSTLYRDTINRETPTFDLDGQHTYGYCNHQAPIPNDRIISVCERAQLEHPDRKIILLIAPYSNTTLPYETISNDSAEYDLFLLSQAEVIILSRSTFALIALCYGNHKQAYIPHWGHVPVMGLTTKYDRTNYTYFY